MDNSPTPTFNVDATALATAKPENTMPSNSPPPPNHPAQTSSWLRRLLVAASFVVVTATLVSAAQRYIPRDYAGPDFIQFWTSAELIAAGESPYSASRQSEIQQDLGWTKEGRGLGLYDFLPYYYPPWLALAVVPLLAVGYAAAKAWWLVLLAEMLFLSAWFLKDTVRGVPAWMPFLLVFGFGFSIKALALGQVAPIIVVLASLTWWLLDRRSDFAAGAVLALLTIKPHLAIVLIGLLLMWSLRHGRVPVLKGFLLTLATLVVVSTIAFPRWLPEMLAAQSVTPMPSAYFSGLGTTWNVVLIALGLKGFPLYLAYCAVAMPLLLALARMAFLEHRSLEEQFGIGLIAPFFLAPYARCYDLPLLIIPALILLGTGKLSAAMRGALVFTWTALVGLHILVLTATMTVPTVGVRRTEFGYFWIPVLIAALWIACVSSGRDAEKAATDGGLSA